MTQREGEKYQNLMGNGKEKGKDHVLDGQLEGSNLMVNGKEKGKDLMFGGQWKVPLPSISFI